MNITAYLTLIVALIAIIGTNLASFKDNLKNKYFITIIAIVMVIGGIISYIYFFYNAEKPIVWKDKAFEKMVQKALNKEGAYIYPKQLENITPLCIVSDRVAYIDKSKDELNFTINFDSNRGNYC